MRVTENFHDEPEWSTSVHTMRRVRVAKPVGRLIGNARFGRNSVDNASHLGLIQDTARAPIVLDGCLPGGEDIIIRVCVSRFPRKQGIPDKLVERNRARFSSFAIDGDLARFITSLDIAPLQVAGFFTATP